MKRVNFGHKGGFPLEQETLIHMQRAYTEDMLEALFTQWGIDPNKNYILKEATATEDGWIITSFTRQEINAATGVPFDVTKIELLRLKYTSGSKNFVQITDSRKLFNTDGTVDITSTGGYLVYADAQSKKVYQEYVAQYATTAATLPSREVIKQIDNRNSSNTKLIPLSTIPNLEQDTENLSDDLAALRTTVLEFIDEVEEDYLPRNGAKPMIGNLVLGETPGGSVTDPEEGTKLVFSGVKSNTDTIEMYKYNKSRDVTELRVRVGDNSSGDDAFTVGHSISGGVDWVERFRVSNNGKVGIGVENPQKSLDIDAKGDFLKISNLREINANQERPLLMNSSGELGVANESIITPLATEFTAGKLEVASFNEASEGSLNNKIMTPRRVKTFIDQNLRFTSGSSTVTARTSGANTAGLYSADYTKNVVKIRPPFGYDIFDLEAFMPSIQTIDFAGEVDGNDSIWCRWRRNFSEGVVDVIANNTENRAATRINYIAIWKK